MQITVYLDVVFLVNCVVNCLVLLLTNYILHSHINYIRIMAGGIVSAISLLFFVCFKGFYHPVGATLIYIGISIEANVITFGIKKGLFYKWLLSTTIMVLIGSLMNYIRYMLGLTVLGFAKWMLCFFVALSVIMMSIFGLKRYIKKRQHIYPVKLMQNERILLEQLYLDTGNMLWDPLFQKPVILLSEEIVCSCFAVEENRLLREYSKTGILDYRSLHSNEMQKKYCFHEIAYKSVGNPNGKLLCFLMDEVRLLDLGITLFRQPVAVAPEILFKGKIYQGLLHPDLISL